MGPEGRSGFCRSSGCSSKISRRLSDGTVLAAWESQYQEAGGLVRLVQTENGWHIFSNRIIYEQLSGYFGG